MIVRTVRRPCTIHEDCTAETRTVWRWEPRILCRNLALAWRRWIDWLILRPHPHAMPTLAGVLAALCAVMAWAVWR